ncbi:MAG: hypothetical protein WC878_04215 [Candidatus Paceibacterota bacterium]|jgi:hypothetical protein
MRKAVVISQRSRRGIPLHWNERFQDKHPEIVSVMARRELHRKDRRKTKQTIISFRGVDWEDFISLHQKNCISKYDW